MCTHVHVSEHLYPFHQRGSYDTHANLTHIHRGLYIGKYPPLGGGISADVIWGKKYEKEKRKRGENVKEKGRKGKEIGRKGKENEKRGSKRVK